MIILASKINDNDYKNKHKVLTNVLGSINTYVIKRNEMGYKTLFVSYYLQEDEVGMVEETLLSAGYRVKTTKGKIVNDNRKSVQFQIDWSHEDD